MTDHAMDVLATRIEKLEKENKQLQVDKMAAEEGWTQLQKGYHELLRERNDLFRKNAANARQSYLAWENRNKIAETLRKVQETSAQEIWNTYATATREGDAKCAALRKKNNQLLQQKRKWKRLYLAEVQKHGNTRDYWKKRYTEQYRKSTELVREQSMPTPVQNTRPDLMQPPVDGIFPAGPVGILASRLEALTDRVDYLERKR